MKSTRDFRSQDAANDYVRKAAKLEPMKKSGKEKHNLYNGGGHDDDEDDEFDLKPKRESVFDYLDDDED